MIAVVLAFLMGMVLGLLLMSYIDSLMDYKDLDAILEGEDDTEIEDAPEMIVHDCKSCFYNFQEWFIEPCASCVHGGLEDHWRQGRSEE